MGAFVAERPKWMYDNVSLEEVNKLLGLDCDPHIHNTVHFNDSKGTRYTVHAKNVVASKFPTFILTDTWPEVYVIVNVSCQMVSPIL